MARPFTLHFACGATYEVNDYSVHPSTGKPVRLIVFSTGGDSIKPPTLKGQPAPCLLWCPAKRKASKRKVETGWLGAAAAKPTGEPCRVVFCQPTHATRNEPAH